jgi:lipopolysaccharide heptosyltransferase II
MPDPQKILVIRFSSIGDIVLATPLLRVLHTTFPSAQIDFIVRKEYAELIRNNRNLTHVFEFDSKTGISGLRELKKLLRLIHYNLVVDIHNSLRSRYIRWKLGADNVVVLHKRIFARTMLIRKKKNFYRSIVSVADRYIESLHKYKIKNDGKGLELFISVEIRARAFTKMNKLGVHLSGMMIGFCPSAKHATKCWPQEKFTELGIRLANKYDAKVLLFGSSDDKKKCLAIANAINDRSRKGKAIDLSGELSLLESAVAMEACTVVVTNDSGLMHIASAMKEKVVAIFGPTVREFGFFPVGKDQIVLERKDLYCRPCSHIGGKACPEKHFRCMNEIQIEEVAEAVKRLTGL